MDTLALYLLGQADSIKFFFGITGFAAAAACIFGVLFSKDCLDKETYTEVKRSMFRFVIPYILIAFTISVFLPSQRTVKLMLDPKVAETAYQP